MMRKSQPPVDPTVSAINQESDQVQFWTDKLKENLNSPYARAQLMQALNEKQQLYDLYQGNINPFQTPVPTQVSTTSTPPTQVSKMSDRDMLREMMRLKALYEKKEFKEYERRQRRQKPSKGGQKPPKTPKEPPFEEERYFYTPPPPPQFEDTKPPVTGVTGISGWDSPYTGPRLRSQGPVTPQLFERARQKIKQKMKEKPV